MFCICAGEITIRMFYNHFRNYNMEMWRYASELKQALPYQKLPFHHFPNKEGYYCGVNITTNSSGFRDYEYDTGGKNNKKRLIFLGDSFTLGWGVPLDDLYSKQLGKMLNKKSNDYEVINMGIGNYNSTMEIELFKWKGLKLNPDTAILMYFINDTEPIPKKKSLVCYVTMKHSYFFSFLFDRFIKLKSRFVKNFGWSEYYQQLYSPENSKNLVSTKESIRELIKLCNENNVKLLIVNIPEFHRFKEYPFPYATEYIRNLASEANVPFLDLLPSFINYPPESLWVSSEDPHANAKANFIIAQQIYKKIMQDKFLSSLLQ